MLPFSRPTIAEVVDRLRSGCITTGVHYAGQPADMTTLRALADRHGLVVVEDAAHALGERDLSRCASRVLDPEPPFEARVLPIHAEVEGRRHEPFLRLLLANLGRRGLPVRRKVFRLTAPFPDHRLPTRA